MSATYSRRGKRSWLITVHWKGQRERKTIHGSEQDAKDLVKFIHRQEVAGVNVVAAVQQAQVAPVIREWPTLRDALPVFINDMTARGEWTGSTPISYRRRLTAHLFSFVLTDGRALGDLPVDQVTEGTIGAVLEHVRRSPSNKGKS